MLTQLLRQLENPGSVQQDDLSQEDVKRILEKAIQDEENPEIGKHTLNAQTIADMKTEQLRRNGIFAKRKIRASFDFGSGKKKEKGFIGEKVSQNFSQMGSRLTSVENLGSLNLRDEILTTFDV